MLDDDGNNFKSERIKIKTQLKLLLIDIVLVQLVQKSKKEQQTMLQ
jgi:hypothetical protein